MGIEMLMRISYDFLECVHKSLVKKESGIV